MRRYFQVLILGVSGFVVAGCESSGDSENRQTFAELESEATALGAEVSGLDEVNSATLPTSGGATYNGTLGFSLSDGGSSSPQILSDVAITATFQAGDGSISGTISNFVNENDQAYSGQMTLQNGLVDREATAGNLFTFEADLVGTVRNTSTGDSLSGRAGDTSIIGDFFGEVPAEAPSHLSGELVGAMFDESNQRLSVEAGSSLLAKR